MNRTGYNQTIVTGYFRSQGIDTPVYEHKFRPDRKWRLDIAWPNHEDKLAIEVQGGLWVSGGGRHQRGRAMLSEWEKLNTAATMGWRFLYVQPCDLLKLETVAMIKLAMAWRMT